MSDETTTTGRHEPMVMERFTLLPGGGRGDYREETVCVSCWVGCDDETCIEPHGNAPWPCENARLRERVAVLEGALEGIEGTLGVALSVGRESVRRELVSQAHALARASLAQADDGGRA